VNKDSGLINFNLKSNMKLQKKDKSDNETEYNLAVSMWDVNSKFPTQMLERRFEGDESIKMHCSRDGKHILLYYRKSVKEIVEPEEDGAPEGEVEDKKEGDENLSEVN
jgi:hypothetical protein